jgi:hypothetical protein
MTTSARYGAFISYSHAASAEVSRGLEKWLQNYAKPWWRWRAINVFRDETNLTAAPALWSRIALALDQSSHFVLLASPEAAKSKWIRREVRYWLGDPNAAALGDADLDAPMANPRAERVATLLIALTAGEILWDEKAGDARAGDFNWHTTNALPRVLSGVFKEEFQWVDLRTTVQKQELRNSLSRSNSEFMLAVAQLAAPIRGIADFSRLVSEDYRQYRRTIRAAWAATAVLAWVSAAALWQWRTAIVQRDRAVYAEGAASEANAEAQANAKQARDNAAEAEANLLAAQLRESRFLADEASQQRTVDTGTAALVALEALPDAATGNNRPYVPEAELQLDGALRDLREQLVLGHEGVSTDGAFTPDGKRIATGSLDKMKRFMTAEAAMISGADTRGGGCGARSSAPTASVSSPRSMTRRCGSGTRRPASQQASRS